MLPLRHCRAGHSTTRGLWAGAANSVPHSSASPHSIARSGLADEWGTLSASPTRRSAVGNTDLYSRQYGFHACSYNRKKKPITFTSACTSAAPTERTSVKFDIADIFENLSAYF